MKSNDFSINDLQEIKRYSTNKLTEYEIKNLNFIKVMFGNSSRAGSGFEYKIDENTKKVYNMFIEFKNRM